MVNACATPGFVPSQCAGAVVFVEEHIVAAGAKAGSVAGHGVATVAGLDYGVAVFTTGATPGFIPCQRAGAVVFVEEHIIASSAEAESVARHGVATVAGLDDRGATVTVGTAPGSNIG